MDTKHILTLLHWARQDRDKAAELRGVIERLDMGEGERTQILNDLSDLGDAATDFVTAVSDADLIAALGHCPPEVDDQTRNTLQAEMERRGLSW